MPSATNTFVLISYISEVTPDLEKWLVYHLSLGFDQIVIYQPPRLFNQPSEIADFENAGRVQIKPLTIDVGTPLKSAAHTEMSEEAWPDNTRAMALNVGEYLTIGPGFGPIAQEVSALDTDFAAWAMPIVEQKNPDNQAHADFRTLFRMGAFHSHNGQRPIIPSDETDCIWLGGSGLRIDPNSVLWGAAQPSPRDTLGAVIKLSAEVDPTMLGCGSRVSGLTDYINNQLPQRPWSVDQIKTLGLSENPRKDPAGLDPTALNLAENPDGADTEASQQDVPDWYTEIRPAGPIPGSFKRLEHSSLVLIQRPSDTLVVTFDNLSAVNNLSPQRAPWAYKVLRQQGCAHLGVLAHRKDWFREPNLIAEMEAMRDQGLFRGYKNVIFTGTSMGGFAALAFSSLSPGARVLAFSPQSTLDEDIVPWETRFSMGRLRNWRLPFSDAAFEIEPAEQVVVISDPNFDLDQRHVDRLTTPNVIKLKAWYSGHFSPVFLNRADLLKPVMTKMIEGTLTEDVFYRLYRGRRKLPWYKRSLEETLVQKGHKELALRVGPAFRKAKNRDNAPEAVKTR
ncbi:hypothetical protein [Roseovarius arcticus]|uniref:hypothetical protein n=1 Tax=Roseovarius arcticus TaxID=2547404 RepID=UPI00111032FD|nr:hypothetical protein [Roseovarius arcticus]